MAATSSATLRGLRSRSSHASIDDQAHHRSGRPRNVSRRLPQAAGHRGINHGEAAPELTVTGSTRSRHRVRRPLATRPKHSRQGTLDLLGQIGGRAIGGRAIGRRVPGLRSREPGREVCEPFARLPSWLADTAAVTALNLTEPPNQVDASAHRAVVQVSRPVEGCLAAGADEDLTVTANATAPGALAPVRVDLPYTAPIAGHPACSDSAGQPASAT